jgi:hypothetical protein
MDALKRVYADRRNQVLLLGATGYGVRASDPGSAITRGRP